MRVLMATLTYGLFGETDGVANTFQHLVHEFKRKQIWVDLITHGPTTQCISEGSINIFSHKPLLPIKFDVMPYYVDPLFHLSKTAKLIKENKYDLVHSGTPDFLGLFVQKYSKENNVPFVCSYHIDASKVMERRARKVVGSVVGKIASDILGSYCTWYYDKSDLLLVPTKALSLQLKNKQTTRVGVLGRGVDTKKFSPTKRTLKHSGIPMALSVGRIEPEKNLELLETIFSKNLELKLTIVGSGSYLKTLQKKLPNARYTGKLRGEALYKEFANADYFVIPSLVDVFGNVVIEAMASGLTPIVTNVGGPKSHISHGRSGFVAKNDDEFEHYVKLLTRNPKLLSKMGKNALGKSKRYNWQVVANSLLLKYKSLVEGGSI